MVVGRKSTCGRISEKREEPGEHTEGWIQKRESIQEQHNQQMQRQIRDIPVHMMMGKKWFAIASRTNNSGRNRALSPFRYFRETE